VFQSILNHRKIVINQQYSTWFAKIWEGKIYVWFLSNSDIIMVHLKTISRKCQHIKICKLKRCLKSLVPLTWVKQNYGYSHWPRNINHSKLRRNFILILSKFRYWHLNRNFDLICYIWQNRNSNGISSFINFGFDSDIGIRNFCVSVCVSGLSSNIFIILRHKNTVWQAWDCISPKSKVTWLGKALHKPLPEQLLEFMLNRLLPVNERAENFNNDYPMDQPYSHCID
jgi:hypothetical protein